MPRDTPAVPEGSVAHRGHYVPLLVSHLDSRLSRVEATVAAQSERIDEHRADAKEFRAEVASRFDRVDACFDKVDARFDKVDARFDRLEVRFEKIDARFEKVDEKFDRVQAQARTHLYMCFSALTAATLGLAGIMARGFHWL